MSNYKYEKIDENTLRVTNIIDPKNPVVTNYKLADLKTQTATLKSKIDNNIVSLKADQSQIRILQRHIDTANVLQIKIN